MEDTKDRIIEWRKKQKWTFREVQYKFYNDLAYCIRNSELPYKDEFDLSSVEVVYRNDELPKVEKVLVDGTEKDYDVICQKFTIRDKDMPSWIDNKNDYRNHISRCIKEISRNIRQENISPINPCNSDEIHDLDHTDKSCFFSIGVNDKIHLLVKIFHDSSWENHHFTIFVLGIKI